MLHKVVQKRKMKLGRHIVDAKSATKLEMNVVLKTVSFLFVQRNSIAAVNAGRFQNFPLRLAVLLVIFEFFPVVLMRTSGLRIRHLVIAWSLVLVLLLREIELILYPILAVITRPIMTTAAMLIAMPI